MPGDGRTLIHVSSGYNTGRMISVMTGCDKTIGKVYNLASPTPMEYVEYLRMFANAIGTEPVMVFVPSNLVLSIKHADMENNLLEELAQFNLYFSIESFQSDFPDVVFEPLEIAAQRVVSWQFEHNLVKYGPCIDDRIIAEYQRCIKGFSLH